MPLKLRIKKFLSKNKLSFKFCTFVYTNFIDFFNGHIIKNCFSYIKTSLFHNKDKNLLSTIEDGYLRIRITERCNAKCKFCKYHNWNGRDIDSKILYNYLLPLYKQVKVIDISGGDSLIAK